ncbi:MAG TPA: hypothetical protein PKU83_07525 [Chryseolinea sp.]|nr:hypothetical protein [Chryseolinea sp.]
MDKNQFATILKHYSGSSVEEAQEVLSLKGLYPYSQLLHTLSARVSKDHGFSNQQSELQLAAVYAADRMVLKDITTRDIIEQVEIKKEIESKREIKDLPKDITPETVVVQPEESDTVADELMHDLERLSELKHNFEALYIDQPDAKIKPVKKEQTEKKEDIVVKPEPVHVDSGLTKKQRIIELAKSLQAEKEAVTTKEVVKPKAVAHKINSSEKFIEEIKISKKEIKPEDEKQKEQIQIIDQFIKIQPSISNVKDRIQQAPAGDLSTIKSGEFGDNIVSETLVELLIKQGKKDKAIEVLKKLIWKFPQKKAFFAAQIEDLKK